MATSELLTALVGHLRRRCGDGPTDGELLARFAVDRDESAFAELMARHGGLVLGVARRHLPDRQAAEDVVEATFLALARNARRLGRAPSLVNWLYTVAVRQSRKTRLRFARNESLLKRLPAAAAIADPLAIVSGRELVTVIDDELSRLPAAFRLPLLLCALEGLSREEAARWLGWTNGSVKGRLERGRQLLRERLAKRGLTVPSVLAGGLLSEPAGRLRAEFAGTVARAALATPMTAPPLKALALAAVAVVALAAGTGAALLPGGQPPSKAGSLPPVAYAPGSPNPSSPRVDAEGVPLPPQALARLGLSRMRHANMIRHVAWSPDERRIASADWAGGLRVWEAATGKLLHRWDYRTADDPLCTLMPVSFGGDALHCVFFGRQVCLCTLDSLSGRELRRIELRGGKAVDRIAFSRDGRLLAISWDADEAPRFVRVYDTATTTEILRIPYEGTRAMGLAFSAGGRAIAIADGRDTLGLYDTTNGRLVGTLKQDGLSFAEIALSPDGRSAITMAHDHGSPRVQLWDLPSGNLRRRGINTGGYPSGLAFSPDSRLAVAGSSGGPTVLLDATTGNERRQLHNFFGGLVSAFSPDGRWLTVGSNSGTVTLWDVETGKPLSGSAEPIVYVGELRFSPDGRQLIGLAGKPIAWDLSTGREIPRFAEIPVSRSYAVLSPDNQTLALAWSPVRLFDTATGREIREVRLEKMGPGALAFTPDGRRLVCGVDDGSIRIFDVATGATVMTLTGHAGAPDRLVVSPDGWRLASSSTDDVRRGIRGFRLWDLRSGQHVKVQPRGDWIAGKAFSRDGKRFATVSRPPNKEPAHNSLQIWDVATGREVRSGDINATFGYDSVAFTPDGRTLIVGGGDGVVRLWEIASASVRHEFAGHVGPAHTLAVAPDGKTLASASNDAPVYLWDVYGRSEPQSPPSADELSQCWTALAGSDAATAFRAIRRLINAPDAATGLFRDRLKPLPPVDADRVKTLLRQLDSAKVADRQAATKELESIADRVPDQLQAALAETKSADAQRALEEICERLGDDAPESLRALRAVEALEQIATPAARDHLKALAGGAPGAALTRAAAKAKRRLDAR